jgi:hypothetical protein
MKRTPSEPSKGFALKACYTIRDLSTMTGLHRDKVRRFLLCNRVKLLRVGNSYMVSLDSLQRAFPDLWNSIVCKAEIERFMES